MEEKDLGEAKIWGSVDRKKSPLSMQSTISSLVQKVVKNEKKKKIGIKQ